MSFPKRVLTPIDQVYVVSSEPSVEEKARRVVKFRRIVGYRKIAGVVMAAAGIGLLFVGLREDNGTLPVVNGVLFAGYGCFMVWQAAKAQRRMR